MKRGFSISFLKSFLLPVAPKILSYFVYVAYVDAIYHFCLHDQLRKIVSALPRKLIVFVTHHHRDHVDGKLYDQSVLST